MKKFLLICLVFICAFANAQQPTPISGSLRYKKIAVDEVLGVPADTASLIGFFRSTSNIAIMGDSVLYVWSPVQNKWIQPRTGAGVVTWSNIAGLISGNGPLMDSLNKKQVKITTTDGTDYIDGTLTARDFDSTIKELTYTKRGELFDTAAAIRSAITNSAETDPLFDSKFAGKTTSGLGEGANLYFTNPRSRAAISLTTTGTNGNATYNSGTGVFNIPNYTTDISGKLNISDTVNMLLGYPRRQELKDTAASIRSAITGASVNQRFGVAGEDATATQNRVFDLGENRTFEIKDQIAGQAMFKLVPDGFRTISLGYDYGNGTGLHIRDDIKEVNIRGYNTIIGSNTAPFANFGLTETVIGDINGTASVKRSRIQLDYEQNYLRFIGWDSLIVKTLPQSQGLKSLRYNPANGQISYADTTIGGAGTVTSVALATNTTGTDIAVSGSPITTNGTFTLSIPTASASNRGALSSTDWSTFNGKQNALTIGNLTTTTTGVTVGGGTGAVIGAGATVNIQNATTSQNGLLTSTDWNTFNNKGAATGYRSTTGSTTLTDADYTLHITANSPTVTLPNAVGRQGKMYLVKDNGFGSGGVGSEGGLVNGGPFYGTMNGDILLFQSNGTNWLLIQDNKYSSLRNTPTIIPESRTLTINGTALDLSANRSWSVGTVTSIGLATGTTGTDVNVSGSPVTGNGSITLNIPTASASNRGVLSTTDWTTFNNKQSTLVSGTNIKSINGQSMLGSGDLVIGSTPAGGDREIQFNNAGAFGASNNLTYNSTTGKFFNKGDLSFDKTRVDWHPSWGVYGDSVRAFMLPHHYDNNNTIPRFEIGNELREVGKSVHSGSTKAIFDTYKSILETIGDNGARSNFEASKFGSQINAWNETSVLHGQLTVSPNSTAFGSHNSATTGQTFFQAGEQETNEFKTTMYAALNYQKYGKIELKNNLILLSTYESNTTDKASFLNVYKDSIVTSFGSFNNHNAPVYSLPANLKTTLTKTNFSISNSLNLFNVTSNGQIKFGNYIDTNFPGTAAKNIQVDAVGNIIQTDAVIGAGGTVTSVGLTAGTTGTDVNISGSPITGSGSFTLNIPTASAANRGALSSADWTTFNNKASTNMYTADGTVTGTRTITIPLGNRLNIYGEYGYTEWRDNTVNISASHPSSAEGFIQLQSGATNEGHVRITGKNNSSQTSSVIIGDSGGGSAIDLTPYLGNLQIKNLTNLSTQSRLLGQETTNGQVGHVTIGSGLSLESGVLTATGGGGTVTASNGLTKVGDDIRLGGTVTQNTSTGYNEFVEVTNTYGDFALLTNNFGDDTRITTSFLSGSKVTHSPEYYELIAKNYGSEYASLMVDNGLTSLRAGGTLTDPISILNVSSNGTINLSSKLSSIDNITSFIEQNNDGITLSPYAGNLKIMNLDNLVGQSRLIGQEVGGKVGHVTIGTGLSLESGVLSAAGSINFYENDGTLTSHRVVTMGDNYLTFFGDASNKLEFSKTFGIDSRQSFEENATLFIQSPWTVQTGYNGVNNMMARSTIDENGITLTYNEGGTTTSMISLAPSVVYLGAQPSSMRIDDLGLSMTPFDGNLRINNLTNLSSQSRLLGQDGSEQVGHVTIGSGLSLSSGVLSATGGGDNVYNINGTLTGSRRMTMDNNSFEFFNNSTNYFNIGNGYSEWLMEDGGGKSYTAFATAGFDVTAQDLVPSTGFKNDLIMRKNQFDVSLKINNVAVGGLRVSNTGTHLNAFTNLNISSLGNKTTVDRLMGIGTDAVVGGVTIGSGLSLSSGVLSATGGGGGGVDDGSNIGTGEGVFRDKVASTLRFKSLGMGSNITISSDPNNIIFSVTEGAYEDPVIMGTTAQYYRGDKTWQTLYDAGTIPISGINASGTPSSSTYLRGDGTWAAAGGGGTWGSITGTLSDQTDLQSALDGKQATLGFTPYNSTNPAGYTSNTGTVTSVTSANAAHLTVATGTTTPVLTVVSAPILTTARTINGTSFDGSGNITVTAAAGTLTGTTLASGVVSSSLTTVGTIGTGVWNGTIVGSQWGGTGINNGGRTLTINTNSGTLAFGAASKTLTVNNSIALTGTDATTMTFPATSGTVVTEAATQTLTNKSIVATQLTGTVPTARLGSGTADNTTYLGGDQVYHSALMSKGLSVVSPTATENIMVFYTDVSITLTKVAESMSGSSPSTTYNIAYGATRSGAGTNVFASDRVATSTSGTTVTSFANASIPAGSWVRVTTSAVSGTVDGFHVTMTYRQ